MGYGYVLGIKFGYKKLYKAPRGKVIIVLAFNDVETENNFKPYTLEVVIKSCSETISFETLIINIIGCCNVVETIVKLQTNIVIY